MSDITANANMEMTALAEDLFADASPVVQSPAKDDLEAETEDTKKRGSPSDESDDNGSATKKAKGSKGSYVRKTRPSKSGKKQGMSGYNLFMKTKRAELLAAGTEKKEALEEVRKIWGAMTDDDKAAWSLKAMAKGKEEEGVDGEAEGA